MYFVLFLFNKIVLSLFLSLLVMKNKTDEEKIKVYFLKYEV